jgi:N-methylhydantoinase A
VSLSSDILPEFREYDRTITTVMNDYVRPIMTRYLNRIEERLAADGVTRTCISSARTAG